MLFCNFASCIDFGVEDWSGIYYNLETVVNHLFSLDALTKSRDLKICVLCTDE